ncbi:putative translation initiation inhibitor, yjgF family [Serratia sp. FGI94]|uniref:RidA family protein n=1 Tax=Serratia sp. FGI94 TaxID=671990 RepID=UPI0002A71754|nr:RidA family protein [Serratia sp. FGI94]AGB82365.1 putative translation initiation inhibitor, yjgF family [Serratia sp. FGI94]
MSAPKRINYPFLTVPGGPYVHAVRHRDLLYVSGLTAFGGEAQGASAAQQTQAVLQQLDAIARHEGSSLTGLIKLTIFLTDIADLSAVRPLLAEKLADALPACSLLAVSALFSADVNVEIEAVIAL